MASGSPPAIVMQMHTLAAAIPRDLPMPERLGQTDSMQQLDGPQRRVFRQRMHQNRLRLRRAADLPARPLGRVMHGADWTFGRDPCRAVFSQTPLSAAISSHVCSARRGPESRVA